MQTPSNVMRRKVQADEAEEGFILIEKAWLAKLPAPGTPFYLTVGKTQLKTKITESEPCHCREPVHTHYRIPLPLMNPEAGKTATIRIVKDDKLVLEYE